MSTDASGFDQYQRIQIQGVSDADGVTPTNIHVNPSTNAVIVEGGSGGGGDASAANQVTGNASLASIDGKTPALGQALAAASVPVVLTAAQLTTLTPVSTVTANAGTNLNTSALLTTSAHDAAFGTAGTADAQVRSIQGIASMTPVQVSQATASNLNATVAQATGTNLHTVVDSGTITTVSTVTSVTAIANALPAGTNAIGKLAANSGVDIGDVDVTTVGTITPGTAATSLGKAEDARHTSGDVGVFALGVRNDTLADATNATADYSQISTDLKGRVVTTSTPRALKTQQITTITASTTETTVLTAVASTFLDVYGVIVVNSSATASNISFKDSTAGTTRFNIYVPAGETRGFMLSPDAAVPQAAVNNNWTATSSVSVSSIIITMFAVKMV